MSFNPMNMTLQGQEQLTETTTRSTTILVEEDLCQQEAAEVYNAFERSRASVSKFNHLDVSLAKSMKNVVER
jgi:hypothetical protein